jgi:hypothetical protein
MQDEITPRHQTPGESGDRSLGGYFVWKLKLGTSLLPLSPRPSLPLSRRDPCASLGAHRIALPSRGSLLADCMAGQERSRLPQAHNLCVDALYNCVEVHGGNQHRRSLWLASFRTW